MGEWAGETYGVVVEGGNAGELGGGEDGGLGPAGGVGDEAEEEVDALEGHGCLVGTWVWEKGDV